MVNNLIKHRKNKLFKRIVFKLLKLKGIEIPMEVEIGKNVQFPHDSVGTVIHPNTVIEDGCRIYQNVTIGRADIHIPFEKSKMEKIVIKEGAIICAGAKVLCKDKTLVVGKNSIIAANAVLLNSTGDNEIWAGIPAKKVSYREE